MQNVTKFLSAAMLALASSSLYAQNYYVCDNGNDSNDGRSQSSPLKSFVKAIDTFNSMSAGDSVLFCRGGTFTSSNQYKSVYNTNCQASSVCTLGDYGDTSKRRPFIVFNNTEAGLMFADNGRNKDSGYLIKNLMLSSNNTSKFGILLSTNVTDVTIDNVQAEKFEIGFYLQHGSNITLKNSQSLNNSAQGWLGGGNNVLIENNNFEVTLK